MAGGRSSPQTVGWPVWRPRWRTAQLALPAMLFNKTLVIFFPPTPALAGFHRDPGSKWGNKSGERALSNHKKGRGRGSLGESHRSQRLLGMVRVWGSGRGRLPRGGRGQGRPAGRSVGGHAAPLLRHPQITCTQIKSLFNSWCM